MSTADLQQADSQTSDLDGGAIDNDAYGSLQSDQSNDDNRDDDNTNGAAAVTPEDEEEEFYYDGKPLVSPTSNEDEEGSEGDSDLAKKLRQTIKQQRQEMRDLRLNLPQPGNTPAVTSTTVPVMPTLEDDDIMYDTEVYAQKMQDWYAAKAAAEARNAQAQEAQTTLQKTFDDRKAAYKERIAKWKVQGYDDAEKFVAGELDQGVQAALVLHAEKPELIVMALARNPELMKRAKGIKDPIQLGMLIGEVQARAKAMPKAKSNAAGAPADPKASGGSGTFRNIEAAREHARKTGDYTQVTAMLAKQRAAAKK